MPWYRCLACGSYSYSSASLDLMVNIERPCSCPLNETVEAEEPKWVRQERKKARSQPIKPATAIEALFTYLIASPASDEPHSSPH